MKVLMVKTPAEACGIEVIGENKWITLIQNASQTVMSDKCINDGHQQYLLLVHLAGLEFLF